MIDEIPFSPLTFSEFFWRPIMAVQCSPNIFRKKFKADLVDLEFTAGRQRVSAISGPALSALICNLSEKNGKALIRLAAGSTAHKRRIIECYAKSLFAA